MILALMNTKLQPFIFRYVLLSDYIAGDDYEMMPDQF